MSANVWRHRRAWQRVRILLRRTGRWDEYRDIYAGARLEAPRKSHGKIHKGL